MYPDPPLMCNCEKAKEELKLYDELKALYNQPLADSLIEKKVDNYRNVLKGNSVSPVSQGYVGSLTSGFSGNVTPV